MLNYNFAESLAGRVATSDIITTGGWPPYTSPSLSANLALRVMLAIISNLVCLVPLRILYRNTELAAIVFILNVQLSNLITIVNAILWQDDNVNTWWPGYGYCDSMPYIRNLTQCLFGSSLLAITRHLAHQMALTWPLTSQRFAVGTLVGCLWVPYTTWHTIAFFIVPPVLFASLAAIYAVIIFVRFRQVSLSTESALSSNRVANHRAQRTRRRLYLMVISILIPYLPIVLIMAALSIKNIGPVLPFDYDVIHHHTDPYPWSTILFITAKQAGFTVVNQPWICILTGIPIFLFFGMTKDALNDYRKALLYLGLGHVFHGLNQEYDPDASVSAGSWFNSNDSKPTSHCIQKYPSQTTSTSTDHSVKPSYFSPFRSKIDLAINNHRDKQLEDAHQHTLPLQTAILGATTPSPSSSFPRNPFLFPTNLKCPLPSLHLPNILHWKRPLPQQASRPSIDDLYSSWDAGHASRDAANVQTRVWSQDVDAMERKDRNGVMVEMELLSESHRVSEGRQ